jgi:hypothetical protein
VLSIELLASARDNGFDLVGPGVVFLVVLGCALLFIAAFVSVLRSPLPVGLKLVWVVFAFGAPFLGGLLWFLIGRRSGGQATA